MGPLGISPGSSSSGLCLHRSFPAFEVAETRITSGRNVNKRPVDALIRINDILFAPGMLSSQRAFASIA